MGWQTDRERLLSPAPRQPQFPAGTCQWCGSLVADGATLCTPCDSEAKAEDAAAEAALLAEENAKPWDGCCDPGRPCGEHFDDIFEAYRDAQTERYLEHGIGRIAR